MLLLLTEKDTPPTPPKGMEKKYFVEFCPTLRGKTPQKKEVLALSEGRRAGYA